MLPGRGIYGIVRFYLNGQQKGEDTDLFNSKAHAVEATGPIDLGMCNPEDGFITLRVEVVGGHQLIEMHYKVEST